MKAIRSAITIIVLMIVPATSSGWVCCTVDFAAGRLQTAGVKGAATWRYNPAGAPTALAGAVAPVGIIAAADTWNIDRGSDLVLAQGVNTAASCDNNMDDINTIGWDTTLPAGGDLGNTLIRAGGAIAGVATIAEFDICFNPNYEWVPGARPSADLQSVALHELGHALGLNHPNANLPPPVAPNGQRAPSEYTKVVMAAFYNVHASPLIRRQPVCDDKSGAAFLYPPLDPPINEARDYAGQNTGGCDFGDAPDPALANIGRYPSQEAGEDKFRNGQLDPGDSPYRDVDGNSQVSAGDIRLATVAGHAPGVVAAADADVGTALEGFQANERHVDVATGTAGVYDAGEPIYRDVDNNSAVSLGDIRLRPGAGLGQGSIVRATDPDAGVPLVAFAANERHDNRTGEASALFIAGEDLNGNGHLDVGNGGRQRDSRMEWLGPIASATGTPLPKTDEMTPTYATVNAVIAAPGAVVPWLGGVVAGQAAPTVGSAPHPASATFEPDARQINLDELADGVSFRGPLVQGKPVLVDILVRTSGVAGRYQAVEPDRQLYLNGWIDWNGNGNWKDWLPPIGGGSVFIGAGGVAPCRPPAMSDEYVLRWRGSPTVDQFASPNFCGGTAVGPTARVLTFWVTPAATAITERPLFSRFRLDFGENAGMNLRAFSDLTLIPAANRALDPNSAADRALGIGFDQGEAAFGELEDYQHTVVKRCDINRDGRIDITDISLIFAARSNAVAKISDPRDVDGDRLITVNDARVCVLACTKPNCAQ